MNKAPIKSVALILIVSVLFTSCAINVPYEETMSGELDNYMYKSYHNAIMDLGPPTRIYKDGRGGRILSWESYSTLTIPAVSYYQSQSDITWDGFQTSYNTTGYAITRPPQSISRKNYIQIYVTENGNVYNYRHNRLTKKEKNAQDMEIVGTAYIALAALVVLVVVTLKIQDSQYE